MSDWRLLAESLRGRFTVVEQTFDVAGRPLSLLKPRSPDELINEEEFNRDERLPYWADVWPSALCLAERIARLTGSGQRLLELGCGVGYVCAAASARGFEVLGTDYYPEALEFTQVNLARNDLRPAALRLVDWRRFPDDLSTFNVVAAADVLYEKAYPALIASAIDRTLAAEGLALVADPGRRGSGPFQEECRARGLTVERVLPAPYDNGSVCHTVDLYEIRKKV
ncbi:MAG TPA: methyltransferase domain-containing protein [Pirellulales bacterium]|nr:methyltransferase domain-containing protein [Pirellulales bacterium]